MIGSLAVVALISACVPIVGKFFEPSGAEVTVSKPLCKGRLGFPEIALLSFSGNELNISASRDKPRRVAHTDSDSSIVLEMSLWMEPGQTISFDPQAIQATDVKGKTLSILRKPQVLVWNGSSSDQPSVVEVTEKFSFTNQKTPLAQKLWVTLYIEYGANGIHDFNLRSFPVEVSGIKHVLPAIFFRETSGYYVAPLNC